MSERALSSQRSTIIIQRRGGSSTLQHVDDLGRATQRRPSQRVVHGAAAMRGGATRLNASLPGLHDEVLDAWKERLERLRAVGDPTVPEHLATDADLHNAIMEAVGNHSLWQIVDDLRRLSSC